MRASTSKGPDDAREAAPALARGAYRAARSRAAGNTPRVGRAGGGGRPGGRGARVRRVPPGNCGSSATDPSEPRGADRSAVKIARGPLRFPVAECIVHSGTGAARSRVQPPAVRARLGHNASTKELPPAPEPAKPPMGERDTVAGHKVGRSRRLRRSRCVWLGRDDDLM